jgi:hypothetical protein
LAGQAFGDLLPVGSGSARDADRHQYRHYKNGRQRQYG